MYVVGTDQIALHGGGLRPSGLAHAVDLDGDVICRDERPRYQFPWLDWMTELSPESERSRACPECTAVALERAMPVGGADDPYPSVVPEQPAPQEAAPELQDAFAPAATTQHQATPAIDWLRFPQDFSVWSDGL